MSISYTFLRSVSIRRTSCMIRFARLRKCVAASFSASPKRYYKTVNDSVNKTSEIYIQTKSQNEKMEFAYLSILDSVRDGGENKAKERHVKQGKLLVWERIRNLLDNEDQFLELSPIAGLGMPYGDVPSAGVITGIGKVHGRYVMVIANDGTIKGGTVFPITLKKQLRAQQIAEELNLPCVYIVDSGGAFLPLQAEIFIEGGKTFYNEAVMSSKGIPQVAVVCGMCTAGGAYVPTMANEAIMVHRTGFVFLAGPPLVKAALGEVISPEELGGATMHSRVSGCVDHFAQNETQSFEICRDVILSLNLPQVKFSLQAENPLYDSLDLNGIVSLQNPNPHQVIARLVDGSGFHEFKTMYGISVVTGFAFISGVHVGIIANASQKICTDGSTKATHFTQICNQRRIPIVFLTNVSDIGDADSSLPGDSIKSHARFMAAVACSTVPKVTIITGAFHGINGYAMGSKALGANFVFSWPNSSFGLYPPEIMKKLIRENRDIPADKQSFVGDRIDSTTTATHAASNLWTDGIILPHQTRQVLTDILRIFKFSEEILRFSKHRDDNHHVQFRM